MTINNPFRRIGPAYGNPYFTYTNPSNFNLPDYSNGYTSPFFSMDFKPFTDTYVGDWYNSIIAPALQMMSEILNSPISHTKKTKETETDTDTDTDTDNDTNTNTDTKTDKAADKDGYITDLSKLKITIPTGLTLKDIELLANAENGATIDNKITVDDIKAALKKLDSMTPAEVKALLGREISDTYYKEIRTFLDKAVSKALDENIDNDSTTDYKTSLTQLVDNVTDIPDGLTVNDIEKLAQYSNSNLVIDGKIGPEDIKAALDALGKLRDNKTEFEKILPGKFEKFSEIETFLNKVANTTPTTNNDTTYATNDTFKDITGYKLTVEQMEQLAGTQPDGKITPEEIKKALDAVQKGKLADILGKDAVAHEAEIRKFLKAAYEKAGGKDVLFENNKDALQVLSDYWTKMGLDDNSVLSLEDLQKIADNPDHSSELKAAAKYILEHGGLAKALGGQDGKFKKSELDTFINSDQVNAYRPTTEKNTYGFTTKRDVIFTLYENRQLIDQADGTEDNYGSLEGLRNIANTPLGSHGKYSDKLIKAARAILEHQDLLYSLAGEDGKFCTTEWRNGFEYVKSELSQLLFNKSLDDPL